MTRTRTDSSWRWLAALTSLLGLAVLVARIVRQEASLDAVYPASAMLIAGAALFFRLSIAPEKWDRIVGGPEARRFFAISLACLLLLGLAAILLTIRYLGTPRH